VETVGVVTLRAAAKDIPVVDDMDPVATDKGVFVEELLEFDLPKEERRFWAEDFLRIAGRVGWSTANWDIVNSQAESD
jgi:hypothetical protein